jgi:hypothetical protein
MKKQGMIPMLLVWGVMITTPSLMHAASRVYHLGPVNVELSPLPQTEPNTISFTLRNTTASPVRYFSITCKIMKEGYLIDERICNGFGIGPSGSKEVQATFLWLPPVFEVAFEANKIRTEDGDMSLKEPFFPENRTDPVLTKRPDESDLAEVPTDLVQNQFEIGRKITIYNQGTWFPEQRSGNGR